MDDPRFPLGGYRLDNADADVLVLLRGDGAFVAAFSAAGATEESTRSAAEEDRAHENRRSAWQPRSGGTGPQGGLNQLHTYIAAHSSHLVHKNCRSAEGWSYATSRKSVSTKF
jgi:hypothetical protein